MFPTPTPTYNFVAHNATEAQEIQILHQIQQHAITAYQGYLLFLSFALPLPLSWRLAMYDFFLTLPIQLNVWEFLLILFVAPPVILICLYFLVRLIWSFLQNDFPNLVSKVTQNKDALTFLELTFPSNTTKSAFATEQLYKLLHTLSRRSDGLFSQKKTYSLEIIASRDQGIRYVLAIPQKEKDTISRNLLSFLPGLKVKEITDYLSLDQESTHGSGTMGIAELKLSSDFTLPLQDQKVLSEHDSISFLTGNMTQLEKGELIAFQIVTTPLLSNTHSKQAKWMQKVKSQIYKGKPLEPLLKKRSLFPELPSPLFLILGLPVWVGIFIVKVCITMVGAFIQNDTKGLPFFEDEADKLQQILNPYEQELATVVKEKTSQALFETSIRVLVLAKSEEELGSRIDGLSGAFGQFTSNHQELTMKNTFLGFPRLDTRLSQFKNRVLSSGFGSGENPVLSTSELSDLYHFPYTDVTKTENLVKTRETMLPAPLSLKQETSSAVTIGKNIYADRETLITIPYKQRKEAMYMIGASNMGKTTILANMIYQDMVNGKGLCLLDPHGDVTKYLLSIVPENRKKDVIYLNPLDNEYISGLNTLAPQGVDLQSQENQDRITSSVISIFQKQTEKEYWGPRLEHILRNALLTAFLVDTPTPIPTLYTVQMLLTDKQYRNTIAEKLKDPVLKRFWKKEFGLYGNMQIASVISPVTNKLGKFITNHVSQKILLQQQTTMDMAKIMDEGKILLVNLSKGELGEDRSFFFGTMITSLIQLAAYQRAKIPEKERKDFYLYIDEFQNFATSSFAEIVSETRKYRVYPILSHQNTAQIVDKNLLKIILGNVGTLIALRTSPDDEAVVLPFFAPEVKKGDLVNLKPHQFIIKVRNEKLEDAFTGETMVLDQKGSEKIVKEIITESQKQYARPVEEVEQELEKLFSYENSKDVSKNIKPRGKGKKTRKV